MVTMARFKPAFTSSLPAAQTLYTRPLSQWTDDSLHHPAAQHGFVYGPIRIHQLPTDTYTRLQRMGFDSLLVFHRRHPLDQIVSEYYSRLWTALFALGQRDSKDVCTCLHLSALVCTCLLSCLRFPFLPCLLRGSLPSRAVTILLIGFAFTHPPPNKRTATQEQIDEVLMLIFSQSVFFSFLIPL